MKRWYLKHSAAFDIAPFIYRTELYKKAIKNYGGINIGESRSYGWSNQPKVVTWTATETTNEVIDYKLSTLPPFDMPGSLPAPIILEKDW